VSYNSWAFSITDSNHIVKRFDEDKTNAPLDQEIYSKNKSRVVRFDLSQPLPKITEQVLKGENGQS
jgi:hypothetical protein